MYLMLVNVGLGRAPLWYDVFSIARYNLPVNRHYVKREAVVASPTGCTDKKTQDMLPLSVQVLLSTRLPTWIAR